MGSGGHLRGAGDEPQLLVESVGVGVAGVGVGDDFGGVGNWGRKQRRGNQAARGVR